MRIKQLFIGTVLIFLAFFFALYALGKSIVKKSAAKKSA